MKVVTLTPRCCRACLPKATPAGPRAGFARQVADSFTLRVRYPSLDRLVADLRAQALTNVLTSVPPPLSREALERARTAFFETADTDGRVTELFEIITLTGWKD